MEAAAIRGQVLNLCHADVGMNVLCGHLRNHIAKVEGFLVVPSTK